MVFSIHDFTDSEDEDEAPVAAAPPSLPVERPLETYPPREVAAPPTHPLRITLRPNLNHLINPEQAGPSNRHPCSSDRDSLSPPPPITLRLGMKHAIQHPPTRRTSYSSSEASYSGGEERTKSHPNAEPPFKKPRQASPSPTKRIHPPPMPTPGEGNASAKRQYDWLTPSAAGASHRGPHPEREGRIPIISGWSPDTPDDALDMGSRSVPVKRSHKKKIEPSVSSGPGKAWRKGLRKGMAIPWKEGSTFQADGSISGPPGTMSRDDTGSWDGTPEPRRMSNVTQDRPQNGYDDFSAPASPNFVAADPAELGFPVFAKPIVVPTMNLSAFPKVTSAFGPANALEAGFPNPRKEKVRSWKHNERTYVGIGGGKLKFRTWHRGAPSELGRLLAADREAKELMPKKPKPSAVHATPALGTNDMIWEAAMGGRPDIRHSKSSDSLLAMGGGLEGDGSEMGDGDDIVSGVASTGTVTPKPKAAKGAAKSKGRKSKLANEILPTTDSQAEV